MWFESTIGKRRPQKFSCCAPLSHSSKGNRVSPPEDSALALIQRIANDLVKSSELMIQVSKIWSDSDNYRSTIPGCGQEAWWDIRKELAEFRTLKEHWQLNQPFLWTDFERPIGDFFSLGDPALVGVTYAVKRAKKVWAMLAQAGELLPIQIEKFGEAFVLHVLSSGEAIDFERSETRKLSNGNRVVYKPVVHSSRMVCGKIMRLRDLPLQLLVSSEQNACELYADYVRCNLTGLYFESIGTS